MLSSKAYSKSKLVEILLLASISFELPVEADTTIWSVVYLICDLADEDFPLQYLIS